jgi:FkbM family methyltransferase
MTAKLELVHTQLGFDLLVDPGDYVSILLIRDGIYEAPETDLVTRLVRAGDTCIDAGCHFGYYSCFAAQLVGEKGRVYSFDANPQACQSTRRNLALNGSYAAEVIQAALADQSGNRPFYISTDDQTGLSSLGPIPICKETISVPCLRLETFLDERRVDSVRLLKLDVEGSEEIVLRGLGHYLPDHVIDFILVECFDERLQLLNTSTETIAGILKSAGYTCWEFGAENPAGWSKPSEVRSSGDCNYLFSSPAVSEKMPKFSLAVALGWTQSQRNQVLSERNQRQYQSDRLQDQRDRLQDQRDRLQDQRDRLQDQSDRLQDQRDRLVTDNTALKQNVEKLQDDNDWLLDSIKTHEQESARLAAETARLAAEIARLDSEKGQLQTTWEAVQNSASWRLLNKWREVRDRLLPPNSFQAKLYDSVIGPLRGSPPGEIRTERGPARLGGVQVARVEVNEPSTWVRRLAEKWQEIPTTPMGRGSSIEQLRLSDGEFLSWWEGLEREILSHPEGYWVVEVYRDFVRGKKLIEVGPGTGIIGVQFLREGAQITFMDVAEPNLKLVERVCRLKGIEGASFLQIREFSDPLKVSDDYDAVFARGSLHHTPAEVAKPEFEALASRIKVGGRFLALTYPKERWARDGSRPFSEWGKNTDGDTTPWAEWYDTEKLLAQLSPYRFRTLMAFNLHDNVFNWFDLQRIR